MLSSLAPAEEAAVGNMTSKYNPVISWHFDNILSMNDPSTRLSLSVFICKLIQDDPERIERVDLSN